MAAPTPTPRPGRTLAVIALIIVALFGWIVVTGHHSPKLGIDLAVHVIGPGRDHIDVYEDWARAREVEEAGCVLVRPDAHVAWRSNDAVDDPSAELSRVLTQILAR